MNKKIEEFQKRRICEDAQLIQKYFPSELNKVILEKCEQNKTYLRI